MIHPDWTPTRYTVRPEKVVDYLLNPAHPHGGPKARFFMAFGFSADRPQELVDALAGHFIDKVPHRLIQTPGKAPRIMFEGRIQSPDSRNPRVRTVWWIDDELVGRFVTAVPLT